MNETSPKSDILKQADQLLSDQQIEDAEQFLLTAKLDDLFNPDILSRLADIALTKKNYDVAAIYYAQAHKFYQQRYKHHSGTIEYDTVISHLFKMSEISATFADDHVKLLKNSPIWRNPDRSSGIETERDEVLDVGLVGLDLKEGSYIDGVNQYLSSHENPGQSFSIYSSDLEFPDFYRTFELSDLSNKIQKCLHPGGATISPVETKRYAVQFNNDEDSTLTFIHLAEQNSTDDFVKLCADFHLPELGFRRGKTHDLVFLNRDIPATTIGEYNNPHPVIFVTTPFAGRHRSIRALEYLSSRQNYSIQSPKNLNTLNSRFSRIVTLAEDELEFDSRVKLIQSLCLGYYELMEVHRRYPWNLLKGDEMLRFVVFARDPRDMGISAIMFSHSKLGQRTNISDQILHWIEKDSKNIANDMLMAQNCGAYLHKFEDMHNDGKQALQSLMNWLGWSSRLNDPDLDEAVWRCTFEYQTGGELKRGETDIASVYKNKNGAVTHAIRKGVTGDWKNHFTDEHKELCKEMIGTELIKLGYENDMNW
jgi:hypothetical protein